MENKPIKSGVTTNGSSHVPQFWSSGTDPVPIQRQINGATPLRKGSASGNDSLPTKSPLSLSAHIKANRGATGTRPRTFSLSACMVEEDVSEVKFADVVGSVPRDGSWKQLAIKKFIEQNVDEPNEPDHKDRLDNEQNETDEAFSETYLVPENKEDDTDNDLVDDDYEEICGRMSP